MRGFCGGEFHMYSSSCEMCQVYENCKQEFAKLQEAEEKRVPKSYEKDINKNAAEFSRFRKITEVEVIYFKSILEQKDMSIDKLITMIDLSQTK